VLSKLAGVRWMLKQKNVALLATTALLLGFMRGPLDWLLPLLLLERGDPLLVGAAFALANVDDTVMAFIGGPLGDRHGRKPVILLSTSFYVLGCLVLLAAVSSQGLLAMVLVTLAAVLLYGATGVSAGPYSALVAESVDPHMTGRVFSGLALCGRLARASGSLVLGLVLAVSQNLALLVMLVCAGVSLLLYLRLKETLVRQGGLDTGASFARHLRESLSAIRSMLPLGLLALLGVIALNGFAHGTTGHFYPPFLSERLGLAGTQIALLYSLMMVSQAVVLPLAGWFVDRHGDKAGLMLGNVMPGAMLLVFVMAPYRALALTGMLAAAVLGAFAGIAQQVAIARLTGDGTRATVFGATESVFNLMFVVGPLAGGVLYAFRPSLPFILGAIALLATALLIRGLSSDKVAAPRSATTGAGG
jgi:MFS family permease